MCRGTAKDALAPGLKGSSLVSFTAGKLILRNYWTVRPGRHAPIGWCAAKLTTPRPLYIVSLRDPYGLAVSLYDYYATCQHCWLDGHEDWTFIKFVKYVQARERQLEREVAATAYFERLLETNDTKAWILASQPQYNFLVPADCDHPSLAIAIANLLKCDIVINTDRLSLQLVAQLSYHAPYLKSFHLVVKNTLALNANHSAHTMRTKQVLGPAIRDRLLREVPSLRIDIELYSVAQRIADIRTSIALRGHRSSAHRLPPLHERSCDLAFDNIRLASRVQAAQLQNHCLVP